MKTGQRKVFSDNAGGGGGIQESLKQYFRRRGRCARKCRRRKEKRKCIGRIRDAKDLVVSSFHQVSQGPLRRTLQTTCFLCHSFTTTWSDLTSHNLWSDNFVSESRVTFSPNLVISATKERATKSETTPILRRRGENCRTRQKQGAEDGLGRASSPNCKYNLSRIGPEQVVLRIIISCRRECSVRS